MLRSEVTKRKMERKISEYADIINVEYTGSKTRRRMPVSDRAAQFAPFAALTGHDAAIIETARLTEQRVDLDDRETDILNEKLRIVSDIIIEHPILSVKYFKKDSKKSGGAYLALSGKIKEIDEARRMLVFDVGEVPIDDVVSLEGDVFSVIEEYS